MSALPTILPNGVIAVYGMGGYTSDMGLTVRADSDFRFGHVDKVYDGGAVFVYGGDEVLFREADVTYRLIFNDYPYTIIPARLVANQGPPPP